MYISGIKTNGQTIKKANLVMMTINQIKLARPFSRNVKIKKERWRFF